MNPSHGLLHMYWPVVNLSLHKGMVLGSLSP